MQICVYCGSSGQVNPNYFEAARRLGEIFAQENISLVYGAGHMGLMGKVADSMLENNGKVTGVIPRFMVDEGWSHKALSDLVITENMHERKQTMARLADAVVAMPGGCGTFEELLEIITWKQLGLFTKPIVILNVDGYYDGLLEVLKRAVNEKFMRVEHARMWEIVSTPEDVLSAIKNAAEWDVNCRKFAAI